MKLVLLAAVIALTGCELIQVSPEDASARECCEQLPVYKWDPIELEYELTHPDSRLRYNIFEHEWVFVR